MNEDVRNELAIRFFNKIFDDSLEYKDISKNVSAIYYDCIDSGSSSQTTFHSMIDEIMNEIAQENVDEIVAISQKLGLYE